jgi:hypothetical protein
MRASSTAMSTAKATINGWHGKFRMKPQGKWHTVSNTKGEAILFEKSDDAVSSAQNVGRMYRTGATQ